MSRTMRDSIAIAYFSMEIGLHASIPTYSGGLGILAGDTLRAAADLRVPMAGISLLYRQGYFRQRLTAEGTQIESPHQWSPDHLMKPLEATVTIDIAGRPVKIRAWRFDIFGAGNHLIPVYFLDTCLPGNHPDDQHLTDTLYGKDVRYRLSQEMILGYGGIAMLRALGYRDIRTYHMNEGHSSLLALALLEEETEGRGLPAATEDDYRRVRQHCVFTTHTPVPAGHDRFPISLVQTLLGKERCHALLAAKCCPDNVLNMTYLALRFSRYVNGVAMQHGRVSKHMFQHYAIESITNGVYAATWTSPPFQSLFDRHIPQWRRDNLYLRHVINIPLHEIQATHAQAKSELLNHIETHSGVRLSPDIMIIGFARRATAYKRGDLLFHDLERLRKIARDGPFQLIYGGKAHPADTGGKAIIQHIFEAAKLLAPDIHVIYLEEYDISLAKLLCAGVDIWLNTPQKPQEASGTSGMKAALNGVPSLSILDGWWIEGHLEGITGWAIGGDWNTESDTEDEAASLYDKLEYAVLPMFYNRPLSFAEVRRSAIAINGSFFNTQRMMQQYLQNAYLHG